MEALLVVIGLGVVVPTLVLVLELVMGCIARLREVPKREDGQADLGGLIVVIPAHNEEGCLLNILGDLEYQVPLHQILVVADNCSDRTSEVAEDFGVRVLRRFHPTKRSKNYALDFAIRHLRSDPPKTLLVLDADSRVGPDFVATMARAV